MVMFVLTLYLFSESYTYLDNNKPAYTNKAMSHLQSSKERAQGLGNISPWQQT